MTFAPPTLVALMREWVANGGANLGIVGDASHAATGTSYHLGKSQLVSGAYSAVLARDVAGLSEAASACDFGQLHGSLANLQRFSVWFVDKVVRYPTIYRDVREVIYSPDGTKVLRWDNHARRLYTGGTGTGQGDNSHLWHTHVSWYRDSEFRSKVQLIAPYFAGTAVVPPPTEEDMPGLNVRLAATTDTTPLDAFVTAKIKGAGHDIFRLYDAQPVLNLPDGKDLGVCQKGTIVTPIPHWAVGRTECVVFNYNGQAHLALLADVAVVRLPPPVDTTPGQYTQAQLDAARAAAAAEVKSKAIAAVQTI